MIVYSQTEQIKSYCHPHCTFISGRELLCKLDQLLSGDELKGRNGNVWQAGIFKF